MRFWHCALVAVLWEVILLPANGHSHHRDFESHSLRRRNASDLESPTWLNQSIEEDGTGNCWFKQRRKLTVRNIFQPIDRSSPLEQFPLKTTNPKKTVGLKSNGPTNTNKFYTNLFLENRTFPVYTHPYQLAWANCSSPSLSGEPCVEGIRFWHGELEQVEFGPGHPVNFYANSRNRSQFVLSAVELGTASDIFVQKGTAWSVELNVVKRGSSKPVMQLPLVQGMGFVTAKYYEATPVITTLEGFNLVELRNASISRGSTAYKIVSTDGSQWLLYIFPARGLTSSAKLSLQRKDDRTYHLSIPNFTGTFQFAKIPRENAGAVKVYDRSAGVYAVGAGISGSANEGAGTYTISWRKDGIRQKTLLMFTLPHHVESLSADSKGQLTDVRLRTTTKGIGTALLGDSMTLIEKDLPTEIGFAPWSVEQRQSRNCITENKIREFIKIIAINDTQFDVVDRLQNEDSVYFGGKIVGEYARLVQSSIYLKDPALTTRGLDKLKTLLAVWVSNRQKRNFAYERVFGGVVSTWAYEVNDISVDFGSVFYNDHHFHYGYWVYAAAVISSIDPSWARNRTNKNWVNTLIRDFSNPVQDTYFPFSRSFDWWHGHSWASGMEYNVDGKNQESSSEDVSSLFAVKMWARAIGDTAMEARADLQLAILARAIRNYYLMDSKNKNHPPNYIGNNVVGIPWENRCTYMTYFGNNTEFIHGIQMLPITPMSAYTRSQGFIREEWDRHINKPGVPKSEDWTALLKLNYALVDPKASFAFFESPSFRKETLMEGQSRASALIFTAMLAGL